MMMAKLTLLPTYAIVDNIITVPSAITVKYFNWDDSITVSDKSGIRTIMVKYINLFEELLVHGGETYHVLHMVSMYAPKE